jgi:uncharacterized protein YyaL (SSP411 family)
MAAALLMRLEALKGKKDYAPKAQETMETFAGVVEHYGLYVATYALALQRMVQPTLQVCVIGDDADASKLEAAALARYAVNKSVVRLKKVQIGALPPVLLPPLLQKTLPKLPKIDGSFAVVCSGHTCHPPVKAVEELNELLQRSL